jgi:hypothetical protein
VGYRYLVGAILAAHFAFVGYVVFGGVLAIRWPWLFWPHLAAAGWALLGITVRVACPLTGAEDWARQRTGQAALTRGFIDRYLKDVIFPSRYTHLVWVFVALVIAGSWLLTFRQWSAARSG